MDKMNELKLLKKNNNIGFVSSQFKSQTIIISWFLNKFLTPNNNFGFVSSQFKSQTIIISLF